MTTSQQTLFRIGKTRAVILGVGSLILVALGWRLVRGAVGRCCSGRTPKGAATAWSCIRPSRSARMCRFICRGSAPCRRTTPRRSLPASTASCRISPSSKARPCTRATCWRASIRARIRQPSIRRPRPGRKTSPSSPTRSRDLDRYLSLEPQHLASRQQIDTQKALVTQLEAQIQADAAAVDNARTQLSYTSITSPIDGRTGIRQVDPGNIVRAADATGIVVVTQVQPISVVFTLPEESLNTVNTALSAGQV